MPSAHQVILDNQTLRDLEIFTDSQGGTGLFGLLDQTRTHLGSRALRDRLRCSSTDVELIREIQRAVGFLGQCPVGFPIDGELMNGVDRYLRSRIAVVEWDSMGSKVNSVISVFKNRDVLGELAMGTQFAFRFMNDLSEYCRQVNSLGPGPYLKGYTDKALRATERLKESGLGGATVLPSLAVLRDDAVMRNQGRESMQGLVDVAAELDAMLSMAEFGTSPKFTVPEITADGPRFDAKGLFHPRVDQAVGNPVSTDRSCNVVYLTGPNMAGKTTFLRSVGIAQILAQAGMRVPATHLCISPVECLFTGINTTDVLTEGVSYYLAEVRRIKEAAQHLAKGARSLMLFDEVFKGTNVMDATEATRMVVESCVGIKSSMFIFSSHLSELSSGLASHGVMQRSFAGTILDGRPCYSYEIQEGHSDQRMGLHLLEQERVMKLMTAAASLGEV